MFSAKHRLIFALAFAAGVLCSAATALAGQFNVKPIRVFLAKDSTSTILTVENEASSVLRLQIRGYAWRNDIHGQPVLTPTDDLIVFPTLVDIAPMERRSIRIGFAGQPSSQELTYRIALDELPSLESQLGAGHQAGLEVRTRITVPVFFTPLVSQQKAEIEEIAASRGAVRVTFRNTGNVHATVSSAEIVGRDGSGATLFDRHVNGWYVLPGEDWEIQTNVARACGRVKSISVTVQSDIGKFSRTADAQGCK